MSESAADQASIAQDLGRTRSRMDARLTELQDRLSPGQILDDLMGYFRGSEGADFARSLTDSVRNNPLPAALTGIGLTWLMASNAHPQRKAPGNGNAGPNPQAGHGSVRVYSGRAGASWSSHEELERHMSDVERGVDRRSDEAEAAYRSRLDEARGKALGVTRQAEDSHVSFGKRVQDTLAAAKQSVLQGAHDLRDKAGDATDQAASAAHATGDKLAGGGQAAQQMGSNLLATVSDNPVLLGALGLAVGALLGALVPQSSQEEEALGGVAGQARDAARSMAQDLVNRGGKVAQQALDTGSASAHAHGLTSDKTLGDLTDEARSGELTSNVKKVAQDVLKASDEAFRTNRPGRDQNAGASSLSASTPSSTSAGSKGPAQV